MNAPAQLETFRAVIQETLGLALATEQDDRLARALTVRAARTSCKPAAYIARIHRGWPEEIGSLAAEITVGETFFLRGLDQLEALTTVIVPACAQRGDRRLRILSAGCATGEEPYSIAIQLREHVPDLASWDVSIRAIDASATALESAKRATYRPWALRETPDRLRARWFARQSERVWTLHPDIRSMVQFEQRNLAAADPFLFQRQAFDVVLCRNVLMYFAPAVAASILDRIADSLAPGGVLFVGHAENLRGLCDRFEVRTFGSAFGYVAAGSAPRVTERATEAAPASPTSGTNDAWIHNIARSTDRISELAMRAVTAPNAPRATAASDAVRPQRPEQLDDNERSAREHHAAALERADAGDLESAAELERSAVWLVPDFAIAHLHLGRLLRRLDRTDEARAELDRARALLAHEDPARVALFGGGFTRGGLGAICRAELAACGDDS